MDTMYDPMAMNYRRQAAKLLATCPAAAAHAPALQNAPTYPELSSTLSRLLLLPSLTEPISKLFRPALIDICARLLHDANEMEAKFVALASLLQPHVELVWILLTLLEQPGLSGGPLAFVLSATPVSDLDTGRLHRILLAYYRILSANRNLPAQLAWPLDPLRALFHAPHPDAGVRFLAIRCYALQSFMLEANREKLEAEFVGQVHEVDCPIRYLEAPDGQVKEIDGWLLALTESRRNVAARNAVVEEDNDYYLIEAGEPQERIHDSQLSPLIANVHGVLLLRSSRQAAPPSRIIPTPTAQRALQSLALHHSLRMPALLASPPSSGKSSFLAHFAGCVHPESPNQIVTIHLADTSLDPRALLGSYVSSATRPGTFEWKEGVLVKAMREGKWVVFEDIDRASSEVLGVLKPIVESLGPGHWIGGCATLDVPGRGLIVADHRFAIFATRRVASTTGSTFTKASFFGSHKFHEVLIDAPEPTELRTILDAHFPRLSGAPVRGLVALWEAIQSLGSVSSAPDIGLRQLERFCSRVEALLPSTHELMDVDREGPSSLTACWPSQSVREEIFCEARDIFFGAGAPNSAARTHMASIARVVGEHLGLSAERQAWALNERVAELHVEKDANGRVKAMHAGRVSLPAVPVADIMPPRMQPFALHKPAVNLISRIATAVSLSEPILLTGETGTGKTSVVTHVAALLRRPLISLNLSHQTESSDLVGGFKPVDARVPGGALQARFMDLFARSFSRKKNVKFEEAARKATSEANWKRAVALWKEAARLARERMSSKKSDDARPAPVPEADGPRKRRKTEDSLETSESLWQTFESDVDRFAVQHVQNASKFAFAFVEGPLVKALRSGSWVLLDEVNLASPETLECIASLLHGPTASITLTELGSLEPVPRHPDFRLFACMNPATDVGKKDLPANIRSHFTEIDVPPPDADRDTLLSIITKYIGSAAVADKPVIMNIAEFYASMKQLAEERKLADGANHRPHFSMRTLARALTFAAEMAPSLSLRRAIWEGCLMAFTMGLDAPSTEVAVALAQRCLFAGGKQNVRALLAREPNPPASRSAEEFVKFGPFYLEKGPLALDLVDQYVMTPSVERKLVDLARIIATRRFPVLIEGPTSAGKTSSIEYLARRTGHRFVRINNHEHTDIQEYIGTYVSDPATGKLIYKDGLLVRALRNGDWIVLDELNLAPTDVLEALNRLLDDNRELVIPETQEVVRPHPHFMLFATQNPPGLYAGRKILSRAFRNRFLEVHFEDVPQAELETILCQRSRIAPSYAQRIVAVFRQLQTRRQSGRVFDSKHGFATLRDLFRWAGRRAVGYQQLAEDGYMLLAERARRQDDKSVVKEVIEEVMKVRIDESVMYSLRSRDEDLAEFLGAPAPESSNLVWTSAMRRVYTLLARALRFNEPVLLVGETGSGKTSVCQTYAEARSAQLHTVNCHQNTETADFIGGLRPVRNRAQLVEEAKQAATAVIRQHGVLDVVPDVASLLSAVEALLESGAMAQLDTARLINVRSMLQRTGAIFEWRDGPLVEAMRSGDVFLVDEVSLADDSVLERLNSVLELDRILVLAERGGEDLDEQVVIASPAFKLVATMNPGGDYGKKELSPALRNRFTEIWVPPVTDRADLKQIVESLWRHEPLVPYTDKLLDFVEWLGSAVNDPAIYGTRDLLAWVHFSNAVHAGEVGPLPCDQIFHHAARMTFLDGLGALPQLASHTRESVRNLSEAAVQKLSELAPVTSDDTFTSYSSDISRQVQLGSFAIPRGPLASIKHAFNLQVPTTLDNAMRVFRACQLPKPILLEGSPGVGKTSLITALANISGYHLCRINLSDQTDLMDLFGSDLPVEGGKPGEFAWKDAEFLRALQEGHWVLLDEMNLAPQAVLEGLNAVLDHRGTVYIPELGRSFTRHPSFRIFAAQNPLHQGGGRKGLPKSFINRFTKVYVDELTPNDLLLVCKHLFPDYPSEVLQRMISFNSALHEEVSVKRSFAKEGAPWEFNLRDVVRWASLLRQHHHVLHPVERLWPAYLSRFRTTHDADRAWVLFRRWFPDVTDTSGLASSTVVAPSHVIFGRAWTSRSDPTPVSAPVHLLQSQMRLLETAALSASHGWLVILTGHEAQGKKSLVQMLAHLTGNILHRISLNSSTDTTDILGSFEQSEEQETAQFQWVDGVLLKALQRGEWLLMDNANLCNPSVLDRLNSLCEPNGMIVLNERGHVNGEVPVVKPHPNFRLFMTVNPRYGELSRAMRNRGIEVAVVPGATDDDRRRLADHFSIPSDGTSDWSRGTLVFEAGRRGVARSTSSGITHSYAVSGRVQDDDSASNALTEFMPLVDHRSSCNALSTRGSLQYLATTLPPRWIDVFRRLVTSEGEDALLVNLVAEFARSSVASSVRDAYTQTWNISSDLTLVQALDVFIDSPPVQTCSSESSDAQLHDLLLHAVQLWAIVHLREHEDVPSEHNTIGLARRNPAAREVHCIMALSSAIETASRATLEQLSTRHDILSSAQPEQAYLLMSYARFLQQISGRSPFDFSATQVVSDWVMVALGGRSSIYDDVFNHARDLHENVALLTGQGLSTIWSALRSAATRSSLLQRCVELEKCALDPVRRAQLLRLAAMSTLSNGRGDESAQETASLIAALEKSVTNAVDTIGILPTDPMICLAELDVLAAPRTRNPQRILDWACEDPRGALIRLVPYQQLLWASEAQADEIPLLVLLHRQWLDALWTPLTSLGFTGPSLLLQDTSLRCTLDKCLLSSSGLASISERRGALSRQADHLKHRSDTEDQTRLEQLSTLLWRTIQLICLSYADEKDVDLRRDLEAKVVADGATRVRLLRSVLQHPQMKALSQAFDDALLPSLDALATSPSSLDALGTAWIVLGRALLQLYVPDRPIDPAAMAGCAAVYWKREVDNLVSLIAAHSSQSLKHYGHPRNSVVDWLNARLVQASERLESVNNKPLPGHREIGAVHAFWSEVSHFLQEVIPGQKMNALMQSLRDGHEGSRLRAEVVQESISGFVQRLDAGYPEFADLSLPLQWALAQIRLGLALVSTFAERTADAHFSDRARFASSLVIFPSPHAAEQLHTGAQAPPSPGVSIADLLSLRLAAVNVEHHMGSQDIDSLNLLFEQLLRLWLIDRSNEEKAEKEGQSLYRSKALDHEARSDAEIEEEEFMSMFPAYEEAEETLKSDNARPTQQSGGRNIDSAQLHVVCSIHFELFGKASKDTSGQVILNNMRSTLIGALHSSPLLLPETLDDESMALQMAMLHGLRESTTSSTSPSNAGFDFYRDPCVPQVERAALAVVAMERRLEELVQEWPDQMVLQHLQQRCQAVLALRLDSPVAKVLSSLEQLLLQSEDWEMYANRHNSLRAHREELIKIIVDWRRLELSCWQRLLEGQLKSFEDQTSEWWPRLYDACVRGPLSAFDQGDEAALDKYLEGLLPLLDDLLATSPMGQYARRLELIDSFERFLSALSDASSASDNAVLSRVRRILRSTCSFYVQFSQKIAASFASQRAALEKDVRGYIKLASWKDVNVQALKASAVRTHHQLYKTIRKFRDIMRQAVSDQLQFEHATSRADAEDSDRHAPATLVLAEFRYAATTIPGPLSDNTRPHLSDLPRTLAKFSSLVTTRLHPSLVTRDALAVDDFTSDIILRSKELADTIVPADLPAVKREQQQKTLLLQKRKAWSDLLKELKRVGFAINMKPEVLEAQRSRRWVREQQGFDGHDPLACKAEAYFNRLQALLPTLRNALADHHADIQTRDVQRAIMFVESGLSMALHARSSAASASERCHSLDELMERLGHVASSTHVAHSGPVVLQHAHAYHQLSCKVAQALTEVVDAMDVARNLDFDVPPQLIGDVAGTQKDAQQHASRLEGLIAQLSRSSFSVMLQEERDALHSAASFFNLVTDRLRQWLADAPNLRHVFKPTSSWLQEQIIALPSAITKEDPAASHVDNDRIIDLLLVTVQNMLAAQPAAPDVDAPADETPDNYVRDQGRAVSQSTRALDLPLVISAANDLLRSVAQGPRAAIAPALGRALPFLERYAALARAHAAAQTAWARALLKFAFVLASTALRVARDGFCRPPDGDERGAEGGGDGAEMADGTGLGAGAGAENVSKEIEDEGQVEGLQGEEPPADAERQDGEDAVEMSEDFAGALQDVASEDGGADGEDDHDDEDGPEPEEQLGKLDPADPAAVDEKLWGDEAGPEEDGGEQKTEQDAAAKPQGESEMTAKEDDGKKPGKDKDAEKDGKQPDEPPRPEEDGEETAEEGAQEQDVEDPSGAGAPMDEHLQEGATLDLPEDMDLGEGQEAEDDADLPEDGDDDDVQMGEEDVDPSELPDAEAEERQATPTPDDRREGPTEDDEQADEPDAMRQAAEAEDEPAPDNEDEADRDDATAARPDVQSGAGEPGQDDQTIDHDVGESASKGQEGGTRRAAGENAGAEAEAQDETREREDAPAADPADLAEADGAGATSDDVGAQHGVAPAKAATQLHTNPLRNLGDALREIRQQMDDILNASERAVPQAAPQPSDADGKLEYLRPDDEDQDMEALGPAGEEEAARLSELKIVDDEQAAAPDQAPMDVDAEMPEDMQIVPPAFSAPPEASATAIQEDVQSAITDAQVRAQTGARRTPEVEDPPPRREQDDREDGDVPEEERVEAALKQWQEDGCRAEDAAELWRLYESLTHDLSYTLCEQLRLILAPTLATRLRGDYRTGKRLNMKKIVPYVASEYTKDKIWLRRTRPSAREYEVLLAVDDSRSMAASRSVHLAFETLALVARALGRLEVGRVALARFGRDVELVHGFEDGPLGAAAGARALGAFSFAQRATDVLGLLETSLGVLARARERRASASAAAADLWQLMLIVSDGVVQDRERVRTVLRRAEEQRVMVVFVILDALHAATGADAAGTSSVAGGEGASIVSMKQAVYRDVGGRMEIEYEGYLDSFPFEYYVVLRRAEALPDVLASTLRQFFERVSGE